MSPAAGDCGGAVNRLEREYHVRLLTLQGAREIKEYGYERIKLKLANHTYYTPDFYIVTDDGLEFHEVKGFMRDDAAVKLKVAASLFPWARFYLCKKVRGSWVVTRVAVREELRNV